MCRHDSHGRYSCLQRGQGHTLIPAEFTLFLLRQLKRLTCFYRRCRSATDAFSFSFFLSFSTMHGLSQFWKNFSLNGAPLYQFCVAIAPPFCAIFLYLFCYVCKCDLSCNHSLCCQFCAPIPFLCHFDVPFCDVFPV